MWCFDVEKSSKLKKYLSLHLFILNNKYKNWHKISEKNFFFEFYWENPWRILRMAGKKTLDRISARTFYTAIFSRSGSPLPWLLDKVVRNLFLSLGMIVLHLEKCHRYPARPARSGPTCPGSCKATRRAWRSSAGSMWTSMWTCCSCAWKPSSVSPCEWL